MAVYNNPIVLQRADPWVLKVDGEYYFTGSDPEYNCIAIRHASNINDLQKAPETVVWRKHESGPASIYIWAPELHRINGAWYIYFAGAATDFEASGLPTHRMFVLENTDDDPTTEPPATPTAISGAPMPSAMTKSAVPPSTASPVWPM